MSKTLETKKKILELLDNRKMTITELSKTLRLSKATVSQHIDELARIHAVEKVDTKYYKKLKYYKTTTNYSAMFAKVIGAVIIIGIVSYAIFLYAGKPGYHATAAHPNVSTSKSSIKNITTSQVSASASNVMATPGAISAYESCIFLSYNIGGRIASSNGLSVYSINYAAGNETRNVTDYVIGRGSSGTLMLTENITKSLSEPKGYNSTRAHYYLLRYNTSINGVYPGVNVTFSPKTFLAVNSSINTTAYVQIATNATYGTYWINFDGPCGGGIGPELLTIGSRPYNGTIKEPVNIFG